MLSGVAHLKKTIGLLVTYNCQFCFCLQDDNEECVIAEQHFSIKCPITQQIMTCPVRNVHCKHNYDKIGVQQLITNRGDKARSGILFNVYYMLLARLFVHLFKNYNSHMFSTMSISSQTKRGESVPLPI